MSDEKTYLGRDERPLDESETRTNSEKPTFTKEDMKKEVKKAQDENRVVLPAKEVPPTMLVEGIRQFRAREEMGSPTKIIDFKTEDGGLRRVCYWEYPQHFDIVPEAIRFSIEEWDDWERIVVMEDFNGPVLKSLVLDCYVYEQDDERHLGFTTMSGDAPYSYLLPHEIDMLIGFIRKHVYTV